MAFRPQAFLFSLHKIVVQIISNLPQLLKMMQLLVYTLLSELLFIPCPRFLNIVLFYIAAGTTKMFEDSP